MDFTEPARSIMFPRESLHVKAAGLNCSARLPNQTVFAQRPSLQRINLLFSPLNDYSLSLSLRIE